MAGSTASPLMTVTAPRGSPVPARSRSASRTRSSNLMQNVIQRMRPLPFQYVFSCWATKAGGSSRPILLAKDVPDIASFYRIYNNFPWSSVRSKDGVHFFRQGVKPLWEDRENLNGGCWTLRVSRDNAQALRTWEELCLMVCGGELQSVLARERDHVLGISYSPRLFIAHISIWTKNGSSQSGIDKLQQTVIDRLSPDLKPVSSAEYYYKKHSEHDGWEEAVQAVDTLQIEPASVVTTA